MWCRCNKATLYPDGATRCDLTMRLANQECDDIEGGMPKTFNSEKVKKQRGKPSITIKKPPSRGGRYKKSAGFPLRLW